MSTTVSYKTIPHHTMSAIASEEVATVYRVVYAVQQGSQRAKCDFFLVSLRYYTHMNSGRRPSPQHERHTKREKQA